MSVPLLITYGIATLLLALIAGVFLAFSDFVMRSLRRASPDAGVEAMQEINREVYSSVFLVWLIGMAPVGAALGIHAIVGLEGPAAPWFAAGAALYVIGTFVVTMLGNVPMNKRLDRMRPGQAITQDYWSTYVTFWTLWNHLRTASSALAAGCFLIGLVLAV